MKFSLAKSYIFLSKCNFRAVKINYFCVCDSLQFLVNGMSSVYPKISHFWSCPQLDYIWVKHGHKSYENNYKVKWARGTWQYKIWYSRLKSSEQYYSAMWACILMLFSWYKRFYKKQTNAICYHICQGMCWDMNHLFTN